MKPLKSLLAVFTCSFFLASCGTVSYSANGDHTIENCGNQFSLDGTPQRVVMLKNTATATLDKLGVLDRVAAKAGAFPEQYFTPALAEKVDAIPSLTTKTNAGGHLELSAEEAVSAKADLVIGHTASITPLTVPQAAVVEEPSLCGALNHSPEYSDVYQHVRFYGDLFDRGHEADNYISQLQQRVRQLPGSSESPQRVAVVYPAGGTIYGYGNMSMASTVVRSAGGSNIFNDVDKRVFDLSTEVLVDANPEVVIVASSTQEGKQAAVEQVRNLPGFDSTDAADSDSLYPVLLNQIDPPTPLAVDGAEMIAGFLQERDQ